MSWMIEELENDKEHQSPATERELAPQTKE